MHDYALKLSCSTCTAKIQISLGIHPVWSDSSLCIEWVAKDPNFLHADSKDSVQTGRMPRLIWVFAWRTENILLVLSQDGSLGSRLLVLGCTKLYVLKDFCLNWMAETKLKLSHKKYSKGNLNTSSFLLKSNHVSWDKYLMKKLKQQTEIFSMFKK